MRPHEAQRKHEAYLAIQQMKRDPDYTTKASPKLFTLFAEIVASNKFFKDEWLGWSTEDLEFTNTGNLHRIYDAILPTEDGYQEINNPSKLRFFAKCVKTNEIREQLEAGILLENIDYDFDAEKRVEKIKGFISFTNKFEDLRLEEEKLFLRLKDIIERLPFKEAE